MKKLLDSSFTYAQAALDGLGIAHCQCDRFAASGGWVAFKTQGPQMSGTEN